MLSLGSSRQFLFILLFFLSFRPAFLFELLHVGPDLFKVEEDHVRVDHRRLLGERNPFDFVHDIFQGLFECLTLDVEDCIDVLVFPIKDTADLESILIILAKVRILSCGFENIIVSIAIPYSVDANKVNFGAPIVYQYRT